eukprot:3148851-Prymnesium_polylepis.1
MRKLWRTARQAVHRPARMAFWNASRSLRCAMTRGRTAMRLSRTESFSSHPREPASAPGRSGCRDPRRRIPIAARARRTPLRGSDPRSPRR